VPAAVDKPAPAAYAAAEKEEELQAPTTSSVVNNSELSSLNAGADVNKV